MKTKPCLTLDDAKRLLAVAQDEARRQGWSVVIAILDDGGHLIALERLDGTQLASIEVAQQKARCALMFKRPSKAMEDVIASGRLGILNLANNVPVEGGLPLIYKGDIIGAIGVSGVQSSQDGIVAKAGADFLETL